MVCVLRTRGLAMENSITELIAVMAFVSEQRIVAVTNGLRQIGDIGTDILVLGVLAVVAAAFVTGMRRFRIGVTAAVSVAGGDAIAHALKQVIQRPRPAGDLTA